MATKGQANPAAGQSAPRRDNRDANYYKAIGAWEGAIRVGGEWIAFKTREQYTALRRRHDMFSPFRMIRWEGPPDTAIRAAMGKPYTPTPKPQKAAPVSRHGLELLAEAIVAAGEPTEDDAVGATDDEDDSEAAEMEEREVFF